MPTIRRTLTSIEGNLEESMGVRAVDSRPRLSPVPDSKDVGRRPLRNFGQVDINQVIPDPDQPRVEFTDDELQRLAQSIKDKGQLSPIRVRWNGEINKWIITAGERRWRATKLAGLPTIECYFHDGELSRSEVLEQQLIENLLREDLKPLEEAKAFSSLMQMNQWNGKMLAEALRLTYSTADLITKASTAVGQIPEIKKPKLVALKSRVKITEEGVTGELLAAKQLEMEEAEQKSIPDLLGYLQRETELTRKTLAEVLIQSGRLDDVATNPQQFLDHALSALKRTLHQMIVDGIKYEKVNGQVYEMLLFEEKEIESYAARMVDVQNGLYDCVEVESEVEREFAEAMSTRTDIKLIIKLPDWFQVETPIGTYNPDWAIVKQPDGGDAKLYLVRETKSTKEQQKLRQSEWDKIRCGKAHFEALNVDFEHITGASEI